MRTTIGAQSPLFTSLCLLPFSPFLSASQVLRVRVSETFGAAVLQPCFGVPRGILSMAALPQLATREGSASPGWLRDSHVRVCHNRHLELPCWGNQLESSDAALGARWASADGVAHGYAQRHEVVPIGRTGFLWGN